MKLVRFGEPGRERPGLLDPAGTLLDVSRIVPDINGATLGSEALQTLAKAAAGGRLPVVNESARLGACVSGIGKIVCVGLNYHGHIREVGAAVPAEPVLFMKAPSSVCGPCDDVMVPPGALAVDWEVELGVVIGSRATRVTREQALRHVAGYCVVNDVSERDWQLKGSGQWVKGKSADTFAPLGPWLVTADEIPDPQTLSLQLSLNGEVQQRGTTSDMVFGVAAIVSYISRFMTLLPGDVISTGTPSGVGMGRKPPRYLRAGDVMDLSISQLGAQRQRVVHAPS
jgi:2-keto-4-pentenoate hydratase/2-oxohepta-3-ene-1,7-dioic acid hydratase in catechol pathway